MKPSKIENRNTGIRFDPDRLVMRVIYMFSLRLNCFRFILNMLLF